MCKKLIYLFSFVLVLGLTTTVANADISDGLVGYWPLDEGQGATTADLSGNDNHGTFIGNPAWDSGKLGAALNFDGTDDAVDCGNPPILDFGTGDFTVSAWINGPVDPGKDGKIFSKGGDSGGGIRYEMYLRDGSGDIKILVDDDNEKYDPDTDDHESLFDGEWHHIIGMRRDGTTLRVYIDGVEDMGVTGHGESTIPATYDLSGTSQANAYIGANWHYPDSKVQKFFTGLIDDVALWNRALTLEEISYLWNNGDGNPAAVPMQEKSSNPYPANEEPDAPYKVVLSWTPGDFAPATNGHTVYFSESFNDVNDGIGGVTQSASSYDPGRLEFDTTYYWRVDEVNGPPDFTVYQGDVWSFTTEPVAYAIENVTATASSSGAGQGPDNTINGSGLDDSGLLHGKDGDDTMWLSDIAGPQPTWIAFQFDNVYKLHEMWVWNYNEYMEPVLGLSCKDVSIECSVNGTDYTALGTTAEFARAPGAADYAHNTTVDFGGATAKYVRLTAASNWGGILNQYGLSEVRFFYIPIRAREPYPDSGAADVDVDVTLGFRAGREAAQHDVYLSSDEQAVIDGTAPVNIVTETSYGPLSLDLSTTYYWKINEVNMAETPTTLDGDLWNFTTRELLVVDDFESYNDIAAGEEGSNPVYLTWTDGFDNPSANGSTIGYVEAFQPSMETGIVHGGNQSVPLMYDNSVASLSEVTVDPANLPIGRDWTVGSPQTLVLWFHGSPGNAVTEQMYVKLNGAKVVYPGGAADIAEPRWKQWNIDLAALGISLSSVTELSIGFERTGAIGGTGTVFIDDILLYRLAPEIVVPSEEIWIEAEAADTITEPMKIYDDPTASGGRYIGTTDDLGNSSDSPPTPAGTASYTFTVAGGTYKISGRINVPSGNNSFWVQIQGATIPAETELHSSGWVRWNDPPDAANWFWNDVFSDDDEQDATVLFTMPAGTYTLEIAYRETGAMLDAIVILRID